MFYLIAALHFPPTNLCMCLFVCLFVCCASVARDCGNETVMSLLKSRPDIIIVDRSVRSPRTKVASTPAFQEQGNDRVSHEEGEHQETIPDYSAEVNAVATRVSESRHIPSRRWFGWLSGDSR